MDAASGRVWWDFKARAQGGGVRGKDRETVRDEVWQTWAAPLGWPVLGLRGAPARVLCVDAVSDRRGFLGMRVLKGVPENNRGRAEAGAGKGGAAGEAEGAAGASPDRAAETRLDPSLLLAGDAQGSIQMMRFPAVEHSRCPPAPPHTDGVSG